MCKDLVFNRFHITKKLFLKAKFLEEYKVIVKPRFQIHLHLTFAGYKLPVAKC